MTASSVLARYLDPVTLSRLAQQRLEPRGLVLGNLAGAHKSPLSGFAVEFAGHREYVPGDDPRHVDWRVYFRRDKYFVKQYEMETNFVCHLALDCSASMRYGEGDQQKLLYGARLLTTLGHRIIQERDKAAFALFDDELREFVPPANSMGQILRLVDHLGAFEARHKTDLSASLKALVGRTSRREIVMVVSDFLTDIAALEPVIQQLRYQRHEIVFFQVLHHDEIVFPFDGSTRFLGLELADEILTQPHELRREYLRALQAHQDEFRAICDRNRVEHVLIDTSRDMAASLIDYLNQRSRRRR